MTDLESHVRERTIAGMRWAILFNVATIPLSFVTNLLLGRALPAALGYYGAVQIFAGGFLALLVPGGREVFLRLVPSLPQESRATFLYRYLAGVLAFALAVLIGIRLAAPEALAAVLSRFGIPSFPIVVAFVTVCVLVAFSSHFLYAVLHGPRAAMTLRSLVVGFFVSAVAGFGPLRHHLVADPGKFIWIAALGVYGAAALLGVYHLTTTSEMRGPRQPVAALPERFFPVVAYTHAVTVVTFLYVNLVPTFVLGWLDIDSLARLNAAMRYGLALTALPVAVAPVLAPGVAALSTSGRSDIGLRHTASAIRAALLVLFPGSLALTLFAGDAMGLFNVAFRENRELLQISSLAVLAGTVVHMGTGLAVALGAFRSYLVASIAFVFGATVATLALVPTFGLVGAAIAHVVGAMIQQTAILLLLRRRFGFRPPSLLWISWTLGIVASATALVLDPARPLAAVLYLLFLGAFIVLGRVRPSEIHQHLNRIIRAARKHPG